MDLIQGVKRQLAADNSKAGTLIQWQPQTSKQAGIADAIAWATSNDGQTAYGVIDASAIAAAGHSCGGLQAYSQNDAVKSIGIFDSGFFDSNGIGAITKPTFYFLGGPSDIAYENVSLLYLVS